DGCFASVFATKAAAKIGHNYADIFGGEMEGAGQFPLVPKWVLSARPEGQLSVAPFGEGDTCFHGGVLGVSNVVGLPQRFVRVGDFLSVRVLRQSSLDVLSQVFEQFLACGMRSG